MQVEELVERFSFFDDWEERYAYLIDLGRKLSPMDEADKNAANLVQGCLSRVWLVEQVQQTDDGTQLNFHADSDSVIVKGLIAVVLMVYSGRTPEEVISTDLAGVFGQLGLDGHLTANRRNGFYSMIGRIRTRAAEHC